MYNIHYRTFIALYLITSYLFWLQYVLKRWSMVETITVTSLKQGGGAWAAKQLLEEVMVLRYF